MSSSPHQSILAHGHTHGHIGQNNGHTRWSKHIPPVLTISSGETVSFDAIDSSNGQIKSTSTVSAITSFDTSLANPVFGPVCIRDTQPGDVLKVEVLALDLPTDWGWSATIPGFGLLADDFPKPSLHIWHFDKERRYTKFKDTGVLIPLRPFLGCMGLAPATDEDLSTVPPTVAGGNMDCRVLTAGAVVYFPVQTAGALFSCGDGHAAQGHGEVCGTAIETSIRATLRFEVYRDWPWVTAPQYEHSIPTSPSSNLSLSSNQRPDPTTSLESQSRYYAVTGIEDTLLGAAKQAVCNMILWLVSIKNLNRTDAYILASVVCDMQVVQTVNMPNYVVSMSIPLGIFQD